MAAQSSDEGPAFPLPNYTPAELAKMSPEKRKEVKAAIRREKNRASAAASRAKREAYTAKLEKEVRILPSTFATNSFLRATYVISCSLLKP